MESPNEGELETFVARSRFRISSMLWIVIVVAAFFAGIIWQQSQSKVDRTVTGIALAGSFELDGDGVDDSDKLRLMIRRNGGSVVASQELNGGIIGVIDQHTKYLVVGEMTKSERDNNPLIIAAENNGVPVIPIRQFLKSLLNPGGSVFNTPLIAPMLDPHAAPLRNTKSTANPR